VTQQPSSVPETGAKVKKHILILDDEEGTRNILERMLYRAGFNDREMGPWMRTPESAVRKMFEAVDPRSLMNAIGVSPVLTEEVAGLCACGVPHVSNEKPCCSLTCESI
jgi:hypothetical protein